MIAFAFTFLIVTQAPSPVNARIARGETLMAELEYIEAADELTRAAADPTATDDERVRANLLAGIANRIAGRDVEARLCFRYVLLRAPGTTLPPDTSPKVTDFFGLVRQEISAERDEPRRSAPVVPSVPAPAAAAPLASAPAAASSDPVAASTPIVPLAVTGAGIAALGVGAALAVGGELALADADRDAGPKETWQRAGRIGLGVAAVGLVVVGVGGVLFVVE